jgi:transcriptional regulator with PAS, ATPase and Fis domain
MAIVSAIVTQDSQMKKLLYTAKKVSVTDSTILIAGESGAGKYILAKLIHDGIVQSKGHFFVLSSCRRFCSPRSLAETKPLLSGA